jgi:general stress protein 26
MADIEKEIIEYLTKKQFITLATCSSKGVPITHPIAHVTDGSTIYFVTDKTTRKVQNMIENKNVAYSTFDEIDEINQIKSIQMEGQASIISEGAEYQKVWDKIVKKFPFMEKMPPNPNNVIVKITPIKCHFSDYSKGFGYRETKVY